VPTAAVEVTFDTVTVSWSVSVEVKLLPTIAIVAVFADEVIVVVKLVLGLSPKYAFRLPYVDESIEIVTPRVTPVGTLLNVRRIWVPFGVSLVSVDAFCVLLRQAEANPSVIISDP